LPRRRRAAPSPRAPPRGAAAAENECKQWSTEFLLGNFTLQDCDYILSAMTATPGGSARVHNYVRARARARAPALRATTPPPP